MWGKAKTIFLSYRRGDVPGYVRQLQEDLQLHFGKTSVFRDVEDIHGGQQWKEVLSESLTKSAALIVIIGPRWEEIWNERVDKSNDYIVYELNKARELGLTIIPVTINGTELSKQIDLGSIAWIKDKQHYDLFDKQGRWSTDVSGLVALLARVKGLKKRKQSSWLSSTKWLAVPMVVAVLAIVGYLEESEFESDNLSDADYLQTPAAAEPTIVSMFPDITGYWYDEEGNTYSFSDYTDGQFLVTQVFPLADGTFVSNDSSLLGVAQIIPNMPRKFVLQVDGLGHGEYSVSDGDSRLMGWFYVNETAQTYYETLQRIDDGS